MADSAAPATRSRLPSPQAQTALWTVAALATAVSMGFLRPPLQAPAIGWLQTASLTVLAYAAARLDVWAIVRAPGRDVQEMVDLDEVALVLVLVLLEPHWALAITVSTYGLSFMSGGRSLLKTAFNVASRTVTVGVAITITTQFVAAPIGRLTPMVALVITVAVIVHVLLNFLAVKVVVAAATGMGVRQTIRTTMGLNTVMWTGNAALGLAAAALWLSHPMLIVIAAALATVVRHAYTTVVVVNDLATNLGLERDRLARVLDGARDGILHLRPSGAVLVWNPALEELTGIPARAAVGADVDRLLADRVVVERGAALLASAVRGEALPNDQLLTVHTGGEERSLVVRHSLQHDRDGDIVGDIVQLHDRTTMERVARIEHDFLSRVTHELLTPLTVIRGASSIVLDRGDQLDPEVSTQLVGRLHHNALQMEGLVNDLLALNATRRRQADSPLEPLPLWSLVEETVASEREMWGERVIDLRVDQVEAAVERASFTAVVRHLVRNALNYSPDESTVTVSLSFESDETAVLTVADAGRGIPSSRLDEIFAPFTRLEDPLTMETRGIGVGLSLVRQLVLEMDGTVRATSAPGEGATFEVRLPVGGPATARGGETTLG